MSRRILGLIHTIRFGMSTPNLMKQFSGVKTYYHGISCFHTCHWFSQKERPDERPKQGHHTEDSGQDSESSSIHQNTEKPRDRRSRQEHSKAEPNEDSKDSSHHEGPEQSESYEDDQSSWKEKYRQAEANTSLISRDEFERSQSKTKIAFHDMIDIFNRSANRSSSEHVKFIYNALKHMKEYGVHQDLRTYKALIDVLPPERFVPRNIFQAEYVFFPQHQQCIIDLLEQMEDNGVIPDWEMETMLVNIFGRRGHPTRRYWRMMYWMPKFKNLSPWPLPDPVPEDVFELAKLAITRIMMVDPRAVITVFQTKDVKSSIDDTWIVSGQSPDQQRLLENHPVDKPIYVEGGFRIYLRETQMLYFILRAEPDKDRIRPVRDDDKADNVSQLNFPHLISPASPEDDALINKPTIHEQEDGTIFAVCATGTSSKDSLLSWIRSLEKHGNPKLGKVSVLFTFKSPLGKTITIDQEEEDDEKEPIEQKKPLLEK